MQPPPPQKSGKGLWIGLGCGCVLILGCIIGGIVMFGGGMASIASLLGPGEEVISTPVTIGQPFTLTYVQDGAQKYEAWMEVDVDYTAGYNLNGTILLSQAGQAVGQYTLAETGQGSPVQERSTSKRVSWVTTNLNGNGGASGTVALFPIPAYTSGNQITVSGTVLASPGTTGTVRIFIAKRD